MTEARPTADGSRPRVLRVHTVSETGYPYEVHHVRGEGPSLLPPDADPVGAAEAALAALTDEFPAWLDADLARLRIALTDYREERGDAPDENLWRRLHDLRGNAAMLGRGDVAESAERACHMMEGGSTERATIIAAVGALLALG